MKPADCNHTSLRIEPGIYRCSGCGIEFKRKPAEVHIAEMRAVLRRPRKPRPTPPKDEP